MLDLLIINPGNRKRTYQSLGDTLTAVETPVWAGLTATYVKKHGYDVDVLDANALALSPDEVADTVASMKPKLVAIAVYGHQPSASTQNMPSAGAISAAIKLKDKTQKVLMYGGHVASLPERTLSEESVDYVATGEGLHTIIDLLNGDATPRGLARFNRGMFQTNPDGPLVDNVDEMMPTLSWDKLPMDLYRAHNWHCFGGLNRQPYASIYTTLGCPFKCTFCCIQAPFKSGEQVSGMKASRNSYRFWSPKVIGDSLEYLVTKHGVRNVKFADEMFVLNRKHIEGICDEIISRGLDLNIWAYARVDTVKDGMLEKLKRAGFNWLAFGIESGNNSVRDGVDKGFTDAEMYKTLEEVRKHNIYIGANYIFGLPDDNRETMRQTLDLAKAVNAEYANFYSMMAYPGSQLYTEALEKGLDLPSTWNGFSQHAVDCHPLPTKYLPRQEVVAFRDQAFVEYFTNPTYVDMMKSKFGQVAVDEINTMLSFKLERAK